MLKLFWAPGACSTAPHIVLEEIGAYYEPVRVNLREGEQRRPEYLAINPAGAIPAIVDPDGPDGRPLTLSQSGAITLYLAEKTGKFLPSDGAGRYLALQWFMQACSDCAGSNMAIAQLVNFAPEKSPSSVEFFENRLTKMFTDVDAQLGKTEYLAGGEYTVADIALYPIVVARKALAEKANLGNLLRWFGTIGERPAIQRGMKVSV